MKKGFIVLLLVLILPLFAVAQDDAASGNPHFGLGKMIPSVNLGLSGFGLGYGVGFEYGITDAIGVYPSYMSHTYESGFYDWSFNVFDIWGTYHDKSINNWFGNNEKVDAYYMAGVTFSTFSWEHSILSTDEGDTSIGFGVGAGGRYHFNEKMAVQGEAKYRFITFETAGVKAGGVFYSLNIGVSYALN